MLVLAFDPGATLGVALVEDHRLLMQLEVPADAHLTGTLKTLKEQNPTAHIVAEKGPDWGRHNWAVLIAVENALNDVFGREVVWVQPGQWKGSPFSRVKGKPEYIGPHARDAAGLGSWYCVADIYKEKDD